MNSVARAFPKKVLNATRAVFGESPLTQSVEEACRAYEQDLENIESGRGVDALLIAIVGGKGQGKTWVARQLVRSQQVRDALPSGDLLEDTTTRLSWIGPFAPQAINQACEVYHECPAEQMISIGQPYVLLDTPGVTDANRQAAELAAESLSLAPLKLLVIARDQLRAAVNMTIAQRIDGAVCIPIISSVDPEELPNGERHEALQADLQALAGQLSRLATRATVMDAVLVPDFEIDGDEAASNRALVSGLLDRIGQLGLNDVAAGTSRDRRTLAAQQQLRRRVRELIGDELPQLATAVAQLTNETEQLPQRVLDSILGSSSVLETGIRMRLRARLVSDTSLIWFPYRTMMSILNLTQGAWDRVMLALTGSVPSLFGALSTWARNLKQSRDFSEQIHSGILHRTQQHVEQRLRPLCDQFHRAVMQLKPREQRRSPVLSSSAVMQGSHVPGGGGNHETGAEDSWKQWTDMRLLGIEELQTRSRETFDGTLEQSALPNWLIQTLACIGVIIFWGLMAGPVVLLYQEYIVTSFNVLAGRPGSLDDFPHPSPSLLFTSLLLSILPLAIYCMFVLSFTLTNRRIRRIARSIESGHDKLIHDLQSKGVIRLEFEDELLRQAEFLLNLQSDPT